MTRRAIVMFAKAPVPGAVKTRLARSIGDEAAAGLHAAFIEDLCTTIASYECGRFLAFAGDPDHPGLACCRTSGFEFIEQGTGDLGDRLQHVTDAIFERGYDQLVIIGSDSPTLNSTHFDGAFDALCGGANIVFGPSFDGGYYLIALDRPYNAPFQGIPWSTQDTLAVSWRRCGEGGLLSYLLGFWYDVDNLADLRILEFHLRDVLCHNAAITAPATLRQLKALEALRISPET